MQNELPRSSIFCARPVFARLAALTGLLLVAGCAETGLKTVQVHGQVTYQGKPVSEGWVTFLATTPSEGMPNRPATGDLQPDGTYQMRTIKPGDGVVPGEYVVTIVAYEYDKWTPPQTPDDHPDYTIPKKYVSAQTSGLTITIPADAKGSIEKDFNLVD